MTLTNLFWIFSNLALPIEETARNTILASLERRWYQADHDVFLLAIVLNPFLRVGCFPLNSSLRSFSELWQLISRAYMRVFATHIPPDEIFRTTFCDYLKKEGRWADSVLDLDHYRTQAQHKVYCSIIQGLTVSNLAF